MKDEADKTRSGDLREDDLSTGEPSAGMGGTAERSTSEATGVTMPTTEVPAGPSSSAVADGTFDGSKNALSRRRNRAFIVVVGVLLVAAVGLNAAVASLKLTFRKVPVAPSASMVAIAPELGPWVQASTDKALNPDLEDALGTKEYVFRYYVDTRKLNADDRKTLLAGTLEQREAMLPRLRSLEPKAVVYFAITYYTGSADTVPHVPDRCYAADGFTPSTYDIVTWPILPPSKPGGDVRSTAVRLINFEDQVDGRSYRPRQVCYFFQVNGEYEQDPIWGVRKKLQNLFQRQGYFAKIEVVTDLSTPADAGSVMSDFLVHLMPEAERVLPDWSAVVGTTKSKGEVSGESENVPS